MNTTSNELRFEITEFRDEASGLPVRRLTQDGINVSPYFNSYAWTQDGQWVFFIRVEGDEAFVAANEVETGICKKLAGPFRVPVDRFEDDDLFWGTLSAIPGTRAVSFVARHGVWRADIDGDGPQLLAEIPDRNCFFGDSDISTDGKWHALAAVTFSPEGWEKREQIAWPPDEFYDQYLLNSRLFRVALDGSGKMEKLFDVPKAAVSHISLNPVDPEQIMYCKDSNYHYRWGRMYLRRTDETEARPLRDQRSGKVFATHEMWFPDGRHVAYHGFYQRTANEWPPFGSFAGYIDTERDLPFEFLIEGPRCAFSHTVPSPNGQRFLMDLLPCEKEEPQCLYELILNREEGTCRREVLCSVASDQSPLPVNQWRTLDPIFSPDGERVLFRAAQEGELHLYVLDL